MRRRMAGRLEVLTLIVVAVAAMVYVAQSKRELSGPPGPRVTPTATAGVSPTLPAGPRPTALAPELDAIPLPGDETRLSRRATALPLRLTFDPAVQPLSTAPVRRALALLAQVDATRPLTVLVLGDDGQLRRLDVASPAPISDAAGNQLTAFASTALAPDGTLAAFPQRDYILLVDLTRATSRRVAAPGLNELVVWHGSRLLYVVQSARTLQIDASTYRVSAAPFPWGYHVLAAEHDAAVRTLDNEPSQHPTLRTWSNGQPVATAVLTSLPQSAAWWGQGFASGDLAVRVLVRAPRPVEVDPAVPVSSVVAIDTQRSLVVRRLLLTTGFPSDHRLRCCLVLGWLDARTVLVHVDDGEIQRIVAWRLDGGLWLVSEIVGPPTIEISLAALPSI